MFSHTMTGVRDFERAFTFYDQVLTRLGLMLKFRDDAPAMAGWVKPSTPRPLFCICHPYDGGEATMGNGQMIALEAPDRATIDALFALALSLGGVSEGAPGLRPHYHANYYGCYLRDPDGNKLCFVCHLPETE